MSRRHALAALGGGALVALLVVGCARQRPASRLTAAQLRSRNRCAFRQAGSRWAPRGGRYAATAEFGRGAGEEILALQGIAATPEGQVLVYDAGAPRVLRLDGDLRRLGAFGRAGRGPGELVDQGFFGGDWITADDAAIFVLDLRAVSAFDTSGAFRRFVTHEIPFPPAVLRIAPYRGRVLFAVDDIDRRSGRRAVQSWSVTPAGRRRLVRADSMPTLPKSGGRIRDGLFNLQADPLWAARGRCAFLSDGAHDWILRVDLDTNQADTLHIPAHAAVEFSRADLEWLGLARRAAARASHRPFRGAEPTARIKWAHLAVDPDGYIWLAPFRPKSVRDQPYAAWVVNPATGAVDSVIVERFPEAFLPGGAFVSRSYDAAAGHLLVRKYALEPARE